MYHDLELTIIISIVVVLVLLNLETKYARTFHMQGVPLPQEEDQLSELHVPR